MGYMKRFFGLAFLLGILLFSTHTAEAQRRFAPGGLRGVPVRMSASLYPDGQKAKGYLIAIDDTALYYTEDRIPAGYTLSNWEPTNVQSISIYELRKVNLRHRRAPLRGAIYGFVAGAAIGAGTGYYTFNEDDDFESFEREEKTLLTSAVFAAGGGIVGYAIGKIGTTFYFDGLSDERKLEEERMRQRFEELLMSY